MENIRPNGRNCFSNERQELQQTWFWNIEMTLECPETIRNKEIKKWWGSSAYIYIYIYTYIYICVNPLSSGKEINEHKQI
jgi:hypothetical protein